MYTRFRLVPKIDDLGWPWRAKIHSVTLCACLSEPITKIWLKIDAYCRRMKCSAATLVCKDIRVVPIFVGVRWIWGIRMKWAWGRRKLPFLLLAVAISFHSLYMMWRKSQNRRIRILLHINPHNKKGASSWTRIKWQLWVAATFWRHISLTPWHPRHPWHPSPLIPDALTPWHTWRFEHPWLTPPEGCIKCAVISVLVPFALCGSTWKHLCCVKIRRHKGARDWEISLENRRSLDAGRRR